MALFLFRSTGVSFPRRRRRRRGWRCRGRTSAGVGWWIAFLTVVLTELCRASDGQLPTFAPRRLTLPSNTIFGQGTKETAGDQPPLLVSRTRPYYPPEYAAKRVEGEVLVDFIVLADGAVSRVRAVRSSDPRLDRLAERAVAQWVFTPGRKNGVAVATHLQVPIEFQASSLRNNPESAAVLDANAAAAASLLQDAQGEMDRKDFSAAISHFDSAIGLAPDLAAAYLGRAQSYAALGREEEALDDFTRAATLDATNLPALEKFRKTRPDTPERRWAYLRYQTFDLVWRTVYQTYFDPTFGGVNWLAVRETYRARLGTAADNPQLLQLLVQMLAELRRTHFSIVPRESAVFDPSERPRIGSAWADIAFIEDGVVVTNVKPNSPAASAGLRPGDTIRRLDGVDLPSVLTLLAKAGITGSRSRLYITQFVEARLASAVGTRVNLEVVAPTPRAPPRPVAVTCGASDAPWSEPIGYFPSVPIHCEARRDADGIALLRFNVFVPPVMKEIRKLLRQLRPGDALIIDLRGNSGGISAMASGICGWLCGEEFVLGTMHQREGVTELGVYPQRNRFAGPIAILIDGRSASTSEILAAGLKEQHRARLFGEPSAGAALPSFFKSLPTGDLFQFAVADVTTPSGTTLEACVIVQLPTLDVVRT